MVGFLRDPATEKKLEDPGYNSVSIVHSTLDLEEFCSSLLDFDTLSDWTEVDKAMDDVSSLSTILGKSDSGVKLGDMGTLVEEDKGDSIPHSVKTDLGEKFGDFDFLNPNIENADSVVKLKESGTSIEEEMEKIKLVEFAGPSLNADGLGSENVNAKSEKVESGGSSSESESESESNSSSSDSSFSSKEEDDEDGKKIDLEEGEINEYDVEKIVAWSEDELDGEDGIVSKGLIKSRNEIKDLPPVPPIDACLQPHHHTVPVGVISSIMGAQVIVEGVEQHNPLNEGTIFWTTESRSPLGLVDEIFGPVKSPYYVIRYNSEDEVPQGIKQGTLISFVPEFASHVLKDNLYKKGYDASGDNDEEILDEYEFSDDEEEAEYKKLQKMKKKRDTNENSCSNELKERKNFKNRGGGSSQHNQVSRNHFGSAKNKFSKKSETSMLKNASQGGATHAATSSDNQNYQNSFAMGQNYGNAPSFVPQFQQNVPNPGFIQMPNFTWTNGLPGQQGMAFPMGMMWPQQNMLPNGVPLQNFPSNGVLPMGLPNFSGTTSFAPGPFAQGPTHQFGIDMAMNVNGQLCPPTPCNTAMPINMNGQLCPPIQCNIEMPWEFNQGAFPGGDRGRGQHHRGGVRFEGGRGRN